MISQSFYKQFLFYDKQKYSSNTATIFHKWKKFNQKSILILILILTDYFKFRFYGFYNFSTRTGFYAMFCNDFILENFFNLILEKLGFLYHIWLMDLLFENLCSLLKCNNTRHSRKTHFACTSIYIKMRLRNDLTCWWQQFLMLRFGNM